MKLGVFLPNWIGDVVMATPALAALRESFPDASITAVMRPYVADVLAGTNFIDQTVFYDPRGDDSRRRSFGLIGRLRRLALDRCLLLPNSLRTAAIAFAAGAGERIGYNRYGRGFLLTKRLSPPRDGRRLRPVSAVDYYLAVAAAAGGKSASPRLRLATTDEGEAAADAVWRRGGWSPSRPVVALCGGGAYGPAKHWPSEHFAQLARRLADQRDAGVVVLCGPQEREEAARIADLAAHPSVISLADSPVSIALSKSCVRRSSLLVATDSGPRHFAAAFNVPCVALFGPTDPAWSHNYNPRETELSLTLDCRPCARRVCPLGHHRCLRDLTVECVFESADRRLSAAKSSAA